ncbi:amidohydrolase 2 [Pseudofrankia inefficax]|uniref:Amidohydrolase 2 n=2 Tax=Pseudofrankia inefficax (strain DSM 45817 / CECT 9037 / DDB 130130 / EuI1c) TaxID=298654 RepID=E3IVB0_PSEI1|nr:amidohydrolase 2 [Pseudofrankia inefficax]
MPQEPTPVVDSHIHWWDPGNAWMVMATQEQADELGMGDISPMVRPYLPADYRADATGAVEGYRVERVVWVMATLFDGGHVDEVRWVRAVAKDEPLLGAVIGSVDPRLSARERQESLAAQADWELFRGVRVIGELDYGSPVAGDYMRMLADAGLVYDHMGHHQTMADAARLAERHPDVPWILEHCGWPRHPDDPADVAAWREGIRALAAVPTVHCKLSGLAMAIHAFDADRQRPFLEFCLEQFGPGRCLYGSNFPVDRNYGHYDELLRMFLSVIAGLSAEEQRQVLYANAQRIYRI